MKKKKKRNAGHTGKRLTGKDIFLTRAVKDLQSYIPANTRCQVVKSRLAFYENGVYDIAHESIDGIVTYIRKVPPDAFIMYTPDLDSTVKPIDLINEKMRSRKLTREEYFMTMETSFLDPDAAYQALKNAFRVHICFVDELGEPHFHHNMSVVDIDKDKGWVIVKGFSSAISLGKIRYIEVVQYL